MKRGAKALLLIVLQTAFAFSVQSGVTNSFDNGGGDWLWSNPVNWQGNVLPTSADQARMITMAGTVAVNSSAAAGSILFGHTSTATIDIRSGGVLTAAGNTVLGDYTVNSGAVGALCINGGTFNNGGVFRLGQTAGTTGIVTMTAGTLNSTGLISVGYDGGGIFNLSGGTVTGGSYLRIGQQLATGSGTVTVDDGSLSIAQDLTVGLAGNGSLTIRGGEVAALQLRINPANALIDAQAALLDGSLEITQNLSAALQIGGAGQLHMEGGTLIWAGDHLADIGALVSSNKITWANGQPMLSDSWDISWTNGSSVLYADYDRLNSGKTTVWATHTVPAAVSADPRYALGYIAVTHYSGVRDDGTGDSTAGIQQAINDAVALRKTVLFPPGTYQISDTLKCYSWDLWDPVRGRAVNGSKTDSHVLWGDAANRPVIKLAANTPLFDNAGDPRPLISFRHFRALNENGDEPASPSGPLGVPANFEDLSASLFCTELRGIDFDCNGHAGAVGVYFPSAQGCTIVDVRVDATGAHAGIWGVPGRDSGGMNIEIEGGKTGLIINACAGTVLAGIRLFNQTEAALSVTDFVPASLIGVHIIKDRGPVITTVRESAGNARGTITLIDSIVELTDGSTAAFDNQDGLNLYVRDLFVKGTARLIQSPSGTVTPAVTGTWSRVREYVYTDQSDPEDDPPYEVNDTVFRIFNLIDGVLDRAAEPMVNVAGNAGEPPADLITRHIYSELPFYTGESGGTLDITQPPYNATANDDSDDRAAIQAAIDDASAAGAGRVFIPAGTFRISDTLMLRTNTVLFGAGQRKSRIAYHESWQPEAGRAVMVKTADDAAATTFLGFLDIYARNTGGGYTPEGAPVYDRFDSVHWRAGRASCYFGINLLGEWSATPSNPKHTLEISGNGGGRFYFFNMQSVPLKNHADHREVYIEGTREPLWFYGLNSEITKTNTFRWGGVPCDANVEIVDGQNIVILGMKREGISPSLILRDCRNVALFSSGALREEMFAGSGGYLQIYGDSGDLLIANVLGQTAWSVSNSEPQLIEVLTGGVTNQVMWPDGVSLYKRGGFSITAVSLAADADEDGIPNDWERAHGLNPLDSQDAFPDTDGDGLTNGQEYIAGTDPQNDFSVLSAHVRAFGGVFGIGFQSAAGRIYSIEASSNLISGSWQKLTDGVGGTGGVLEYEDAVPGTSRFYRVKVSLP